MDIDIDKMDTMYIAACKELEIGETSKGIDMIMNLANEGHIASQRGLGIMYLYGQLGQAIDHDLAAYWFEEAAKQGCAISQSNLGFMYQQGYGRTRDLAKAFYWYKRASAQGDQNGEYNLGNMYYYGYGTECDIELAKEYYERAAAKGSTYAKNMLGSIYLMKDKNSTEEENEKNNKRAIEYLGEAAGDNNPYAQAIYSIYKYSRKVTHKELPIYEYRALFEKLSAEEDGSYYYRGQIRDYDLPLWPSQYNIVQRSNNASEYSGEYRLRKTGTKFYFRNNHMLYNDNGDKPEKAYEFRIKKAIMAYIRNALGYPLSEAFFQQAGFQSEGLDITSDLKIALFFASYKYDPSGYAINNDPGISVIYRWKLRNENKWSLRDTGEYDFYNCPNVIPTEKIFDQFEKCDTWEEFYESINTYRGAINWDILNYNWAELLETKPLELIKLPREFCENSRIKNQRASLLLPDTVLSEYYASISEFVPPIYYPKLQLNMVEDLSQNPNCEVFLFRANGDAAGEILRGIEPEVIFPKVDITHRFLSGWLESFFSSVLQAGVVPVMNNPYEVSIYEIMDYIKGKREKGEVFF